MRTVTVNVKGETVTIYEDTPRDYDECDVCNKAKRTLEVAEVDSIYYNRIEICLDCLIDAIARIGG